MKCGVQLDRQVAMDDRLKRTLCTYATGQKKYRVMALAMMLNAYRVASSSIDRYVIFSDRTDWKVPPWIELVEIEESKGMSKFDNWSIKPLIFHHPSVEDDLLLFIDADSTIYADCIGRCFEWLSEQSLLLYINFVPDDELWGRLNLKKLYAKAGYDVRNIVINSGIVGRKPDALGLEFQTLWRNWMEKLTLRELFDEPSYQLADEPYAGLAHQMAYRKIGVPLPDRAHPLEVQDYMITIGAKPRRFYEHPGPVISVPWLSTEVVQPAIVHWVENTQYFFYRRLLWQAIFDAGLLPHYFTQLVADDIDNLWKRVQRKWNAMRIQANKNY